MAAGLRSGRCAPVGGVTCIVALVAGLLVGLAAPASAAVPEYVEVPGSPFSAGPNSGPTAVAYSPAGGLLATANRDSNSLSVFTVGPDSFLVLPAGSPVPAGSAPRGVAWRPDGTALAVANFVGNSVQTFTVTGAGVATSADVEPTGGDTAAVAWSPNGAFVAAAENSVGRLYVWSVDAAGNMTAVPGSPIVTGGGNASSLAWSPAGTFIAVGDNEANDVRVFAIAANGTPTLAAGPFATPGSPTGVAINNTGTLLATANSSGSVSTFTMNPATGALSNRQDFAKTGTPRSVKFRPDGARLATAGGTTGQLFVDDVSALGVLTPVSGSPFATGQGFQVEAAWSPDGRFIATANDPSDNVSVFGPGSIDCPVSTVFESMGTTTTQLFAGTFAPSGVTFAPVGVPSAVAYNGMGFNPVDGFLYAVSTPEHILRIDPTTGAVTDLGATTPGLAVGTASNGAVFDNAGNFYVLNNATATLNVVNVNTLVNTQVTLSSAPFAADFAFGPGGFLWGATGAVANDIVRIDPTTGVVTFFDAPAAMGGGSGFGGVFGYGNGDVGFIQNLTDTMYRVRITNPSSASPTFTLVSTRVQTPTINGSFDAAGCISAPTDMQIVKSGTTQPAPGGAVSWTLTVTNNGPAASSGFDVTDVVPALFTGVASPTPGCSVVGNTVSCAGGPLGVGSSAVITVTATAPVRKLCRTNRATVVGNEAETAGAPALANNTSSLVVCTKPVSKAAVVAGTSWSLANGLPGAGPTIDFTYGTKPFAPLMGDWDGNGSITVGTFEVGTFKLNNANDSSGPDVVFTFGDPRGYPVAGDFDGNGFDDVAVFRCGNWQVHYLGAGAPADQSFTLGAPFATDCTWPATVPVAGDWDGDGIDGIGTYKFSTATWVLKNTVGAGGPNFGPFVFGTPGVSYPVVGNWTGSGVDLPGHRTGSLWTVRTSSVTGLPTTTFTFGVPNSIPLAW